MAGTRLQGIWNPATLKHTTACHSMTHYCFQAPAQQLHPWENSREHDGSGLLAPRQPMLKLICTRFLLRGIHLCKCKHEEHLSSKSGIPHSVIISLCWDLSQRNYPLIECMSRNSLCWDTGDRSLFLFPTSKRSVFPKQASPLSIIQKGALELTCDLQVLEVKKAARATVLPGLLTLLSFTPNQLHSR